jgi:hypothetical protein
MLRLVDLPAEFSGKKAWLAKTRCRAGWWARCPLAPLKNRTGFLRGDRNPASRKVAY